MGSGSSKRTVQTVTASGRANDNHATIKNMTSMTESSEAHKGKSTQNFESQNGGLTDEPVLNSSDANKVETVALTDSQKDEDITQDVNTESTLLLTSFTEKHPEVEPRLKATMKHYHALKAALDSGNLMTSMLLDHAKALIDVYSKCKKRSNKTIVTDFAVALGISKLVYDIIFDRRTNYPEVTTWDRKPRKDQEKEQDNQEDENEDTPEGDENQNQEVNVQDKPSYEEGQVQERIQQEGNDDNPASPENQQSEYDEEKINTLKMSQDLINHLLAALLNFLDLHDEFCLACSEAGIVQLFVDMTKDLQDSVPYHVKFVNPKTQYLSKYTSRGKMLSRTLGNLHNLSKRVPIRTNFAACQAVNVLVPLLKAEVALFSAKGLLVLACLIDEDNNHLIMADEGPIKFLTSILKKAIGSSTHRYLGLSASELAEGLTQIAVNDNNKKTIAHCGAIPILVKMLQNAKGDEEKLSACNTLWTLAFDGDNKKEMNNDDYAIFELKKLLTSENSQIKRAAAGALWECEGKEKHAEEKQHSDRLQPATETKHVMISYQWDVQTLVIQLKNKLQADGYKVWMDIDEMGGSTLESMAKAVENASVVLVCVSQKYKESPNCRSEAEYTFQLHKDIIPLMMENRYRPDGWLGFIVGSKFWIDFSEKHKLDMNANKLVKELGNRGKITVNETIVQAVLDDVVDASPQSSIRSWTGSDVKSWIKDVGLEDRFNGKAVERLDGRMLLRLQDLRKESPEFFYSSIRTDLGLKNVFDVLDFVDELDKLQG